MTVSGASQEEFATRNVVSGFLFGMGAMGAFDEIVFHQLLHWHHFYDRSTPTAGLVADGFLHAFTWFATVAGLFLLADLRRNRAWWKQRWWASVLLGAGVFQLFDGIVNHKLLRLHQIRYDVEITPYDLGWNGFALALIVIGALLYRRATREPSLSTPDRI